MSRSRDFGSAAGSLAAPSSTYNGYAHIIDSTQPSGWNYYPALNFNWFINGAADYWQRGTTWTADAKFIADRWYWLSTTGGGQSSDVPTNQGFSYSMSFSGNANAYPRLGYFMPANEAAFLATKTVTMSFWAKNISGTAQFYTEQQTPTTTNVFNGTVNGWGSKVHATSNMSTSWQYYTWTFVVNAAAATNGLIINIVRDIQSASSTLVTGIKLELGSIATPFVRSGIDLQNELQKCQRYYYRRYSEVTGGLLIQSGQAYSTTQAQLYQNHPVTMRAIPNVINFGGSPALSQSNGNRSVAVTSISNNGTTSHNLNISATISSAQLAAGNQTTMCGGGSSTTDYIEVSAEVI